MSLLWTRSMKPRTTFFSRTSNYSVLRVDVSAYSEEQKSFLGTILQRVVRSMAVYGWGIRPLIKRVVMCFWTYWRRQDGKDFISLHFQMRKFGANPMVAPARDWLPIRLGELNSSVVAHARRAGVVDPEKEGGGGTSCGGVASRLSSQKDRKQINT
jgi:hypothetical protein